MPPKTRELLQSRHQRPGYRALYNLFRSLRFHIFFSTESSTNQCSKLGDSQTLQHLHIFPITRIDSETSQNSRGAAEAPHRWRHLPSLEIPYRSTANLPSPSHRPRIIQPTEYTRACSLHELTFYFIKFTLCETKEQVIRQGKPTPPYRKKYATMRGQHRKKLPTCKLR